MSCLFKAITLTISLIYAVNACLFQSVPLESHCGKRDTGQSCNMKLSPSFQSLDRDVVLVQHNKNCTHFCIEHQNITQIGKFTFLHVTNVRFISLKSNCIPSIEANWLSNLKCLEVFILSKNKLHQLSEGIFRYLSSLKVLDLSNNDLRYINKETFYGLESLRYLDLGANKLDKLEKETFSYLILLEELKLYGNALVDLDKQPFYNLKALAYLDLEGNYITKAKSHIFADVKLLRYMNLRANNLSQRYKVALEGMNNLNKLDLGINNIEKIIGRSFVNHIKLEEMHLDLNSLRIIADNIFAGLINLLKLNLKGNKIHSIAHNAFVHLTNLEELYLNENNLKLLEDYTLTGLKKLVKLNIGGNKVHEIKQRTFVDLTNITEIHLDKNNLTILKSNTFAGLMDLKILHLENNEISTLEKNTFEVIFPSEINIHITGNIISELSWTTFVSSSFIVSNSSIHSFNNVKLFIDGITLKCSRAICWMKHLDWKNIFENYYYENHVNIMEMKKTKYDLETRCNDLKQYCPAKEKWCMHSDNKSCESQCTDAGTKGGKLILDGDVCPFQYFCKCICPSCMEECLSWGKIHFDKNFDMFGCSICNCQCEKKNCFEECNGDNFMIHNSTFGCPECKCFCPDVQCDASCYENGLNITQNNTLGCFVCDGCKRQHDTFKILRSMVAQSVVLISILCKLATFVFCIWKRHTQQRREKLDISGDFNLPFNVLTQNLNPKLAQQVKENWVDPKALCFKHLLGHGHFGIVWSGTYQKAENQCFVAIKVAKAEYKDTWTVDRRWNDKHELKPHFEKIPVQIQLSNQVVEDILIEAVTMRKFRHPNILNLIGISVHGDKPCIILPLMCKGDLKKHLKINASNLSHKQLTSFVLDVAKGMAHLAERNFVHCDLAARNCMLDSNLYVKICDFGSAKNLTNKDSFESVDTSRPLPIRWMSTETIQQKKYTLESDVWSYGVLLWEIFSYGELPYKDVKSKDVLRFLRNGNRLKRPAVCSRHMYNIMQKCWNDDPDDRPNFSKLLDLIGKIADKEADNNNVGHNQNK